MKFSTLLSLASVLSVAVTVPIEKRDVVWVTEYATVYVNKNNEPTTLAESATQTSAATTEDAEETQAATTEAASPTTVAAAATTEAATTSSTEAATTSTTEATTEATSEAAETTSTPTTVEPSTTSIESTPSATSPSSEEFPNHGEMTYYDTGMGACGWTSHDSDYIVALSQEVFNKKTPNGNPNNNPYCGKQIEAKWGDSTVIVTVVDSCPGCKPGDLDFSPTAFSAIADKDLGRTDFSWRWIDEVN